MILSDEQHLFVHDREILAKDLANKSEEECYRILCGYKRGKEKYKKPSLDHIVPKSKGGTNDIENLQFLSWFENRCKNDMSKEDWNNLKLNIQEYFI